ncbi:unknown [Roseburia sp. CAG:197]|nr:unknown [Roseburia sp. CAG:197]
MKFCKFKIVTILITLTIICTCVPINTYAARSGTASQPCKLKDGTKKVVSAKEYWFSCTTRGVTDFIIKTGKKSDIIVYKKKTFGKKQIFSVTSKTSFSKTLSDCAINNNSNKYLVYVKAPSSTSISCQIKTHTDTITSSKGAMWVPDDKSARYDTNILYMRYWYVDKNRVGPENLR